MPQLSQRVHRAHVARQRWLPLALLGAAATLGACSGGEEATKGSGASGGSSSGISGAGSGTGPSSGGAPGTAGGVATGGAGMGAAGTLGAAGRGGATGGAGASGGAAGSNAGTGGGTSNGGTSNGGAGGAGAGRNGGGRSSGGRAGSGGAAGTANGGMTGGAGKSGSGGAATLPFSYLIGADVTDQEPQPDATRANLLTLMQSHGFNAVRLRTFVDPKAADGYDQTNGYDDITHTVAFGKQIKDAGMALLVDFHYSDNWADPGKQCVPVAWQSYTTIADLASALHDYTKDAITKLVAGGARPDMVQIGNEITPGMLLHRCDSGGHPTGSNPVTGSVNDWTNLGALLKAGSDAVKEVDPSIVVSLHIDQGDGLSTSKSFITNAQKQGVVFEAFGESCYTMYQGQPSGWQATFDGLASSFPTLQLFIAEYGPAEREANDIIYGLANEQGIGTFNWEPTTQGDWNTGHDLLRRSGSTYTAQPDLALYDQMKIDFADRL